MVSKVKTMGPSKRPPLAYVAVLSLGACMIPFLSQIDLNSTRTPAFRRSLAFKDANYYSTLQSGVDPSIERHARESADTGNDICSEVFVYLPGPFAFHGHGSQLNNYILALMTATYMGMPMVLREPPLDKQIYAGGSQFGCPVDTFEESRTEAGQTSWDVKPGFPSGLSRLIEHPTWLSHGCSISCVEDYDYEELTSTIARTQLKGELPSITCQNPDGKTVKAHLSGNFGTRLYYRSIDKEFTQRPSPQARKWALQLGASPEEAEIFTNIRSPREIWDFATALMNKSGILRYQPWIARDVEMFIKSFDIPFDHGYDTIHVRRGDKLEMESRGEVVNYWKSQGYSDESEFPTDYIPFAHYLSQYDKNECADKGVKSIDRHVYVATDDPIVVKEEIAKLTNSEGGNIALVNGCHSLTFYFNPTDDSNFHIDEGGDNDSCFSRYHRNIASMADFMIIAKSSTFIGEYNSNWGRLLRTVRTVMNDVDTKINGADRYTKTLDTRVAWGSTNPRNPGI